MFANYDWLCFLRRHTGKDISEARRWEEHGKSVREHEIREFIVDYEITWKEG
jgi:hypothetical protein